MIYRLHSETLTETPLPLGCDARRFVIHRHRDGEGPHLDLRLEQEGYLLGFRIDGTALGGTCWATMKAPHPLSWLEQDGDAIREDGGAWYWEEGGPNGGALVLNGQTRATRVRIDAARGISAAAIGALREAAAGLGVSLEDLAGLAEDGRAARERAIARYCGLGRELDGDHFDGGWWRATLAGQRLGVIQQQLAGLEQRFDAKYPPLPVSRPVALEGAGEDGGTGRALGIIRG